MRPIAAIDVGSNSVLMMLVRPTGPSSFELIEDRIAITRLGQGVDARRALAPEAVERTLGALRGFAERARELDAEVIAVGTSALRDAANADLVLGPGAALLGATIAVISGTDEAKLTFAGTLHDLPLPPLAVPTVVDIGGGSTELCRRDASGQWLAHSLELGAVRSHERHALGVPATAAQLAALRAEALHALSECPIQPTRDLVAVAGTATTLAAIAQRLEPYDGRRVHGFVLSAGEISALANALAAMGPEERAQVPGLAPPRAEVIAAGATILDCVCAHARAERVIVSNGGLRVGVVLAALARRGAGPTIDPDQHKG